MLLALTAPQYDVPYHDSELSSLWQDGFFIDDHTKTVTVTLLLFNPKFGHFTVPNARVRVRVAVRVAVRVEVEELHCAQKIGYG